MRIAILGTRGIPASYGGFETFAEHLSTRLVARGHDVTVYCRAHYVSPRQLEYHGVRLKALPNPAQVLRYSYSRFSFRAARRVLAVRCRPDLQRGKRSLCLNSAGYGNTRGYQCRWA